MVVRAEVIRDDGTRESVELGSVERGPSTAANDVGLTLAESKPLVAQLQVSIIESMQKCGALVWRSGRRTMPAWRTLDEMDRDCRSSVNPANEPVLTLN